MDRGKNRLGELRDGSRIEDGQVYGDIPWGERTAPDRVQPRECIRAARDALNKAYSHPGITDGRHALVFIAEAVDWQRRALEQMAQERPDA